MSKAKDTIKEFREKLFETKKKEAVEEAQKTLEKNLDLVAYDVIQNPDKKNRDYLLIKIKYDLETRSAVVTDVLPFKDKTVGLSIQLDKENRRYLFHKITGVKK
jgi:hypothetical protein